MFNWLRSLFRASKPATGEAGVRAAYDLGDTTGEDKSARELWKRADGLSARGANSLEVRKTLRERSRYAIHEANSYADGICQTIANDLIGTGPRLQILTDNPELNKGIEQAWADYAKAINLPELLHTAAQAKFTDGEAFFVLGTNPANDNPVQLYPRLIECDQVTTPALLWSLTPESNAVDGIVFDAAGNPAEYHVLTDHPGDLLSWSMEYDKVPAASVIHWFRKKRPGQARGVPEMTTGITALEEMRRYALAVVAAAETAADMAIAIKTQQGANIDADADTTDDFDAIPIKRRMLVRLPAGHDLTGVHAEQPTDTYPSFKKEMLCEAARCTNMPYGMVAGDSSDSSYSGGRQEVQGWQLTLLVSRSQCEHTVLWRLFAAWYAEARLIPGVLPAMAPPTPAGMPMRWDWDRREHVDPKKEADAETASIANRTRSRTEICAARGRDWQGQVLPQLVAEEEALKAAGLQSASSPAQNQPTNAEPPKDDGTDANEQEVEEIEPADQAA